MLITFFAGIFYNFFNRFKINIKFSVLDTHIKISWRKKFCGHVRTFGKLWSRTRTKRAKKQKSFFQTWIRINYIFQFWFWTGKLLKPFHSNIHIYFQVPTDKWEDFTSRASCWGSHRWLSAILEQWFRSFWFLIWIFEVSHQENTTIPGTSLRLSALKWLKEMSPLRSLAKTQT